MAKQDQLNMKNNLTQEQELMAANAWKNAKDIKCECGGLIFQQALKIKFISRLLTGESEDMNIPVPTLVCVECHKELNLEENKAQENNEIVIDFKKK